MSAFDDENALCLRVDHMGHVVYDGESEDSEETASNDFEEACGEQITMEGNGLPWNLVPHLRPRVLGDAGAGERHSPSHLTGATLVSFTEENLLVLFGGTQETDPTSETWIYSIESKLWALQHIGEAQLPQAITIKRSEKGIPLHSFAQPEPRAGHCAASLQDIKLAMPPHPTKEDLQYRYSPQMIVFGGANVQKSVYYNDLWLFDLECRAWLPVQTTGTKPSPRWQAVCGVCDLRLFIFGGEGADFEVTNDLHLYDHATRMWRDLRTTYPTPAPRMLHAACTVGDKLVVSGGVSSSTRTTATADTWVLEMRTMLWRRIGESSHDSPFHDENAAVVKPPVPTFAGSMSASGVFGSTGQTETEVPADGAGGVEGDQPAKVASPPPELNSPQSLNERARTRPRQTIEGHVMIGCDGYVLLHGGKTMSGRFQRHSWRLDLLGERWTRLPVAGPNVQGLPSEPQGRWRHAACSMVKVSTTSSMALALSLNDMQTQRMHLTVESETKQYINKMRNSLQQQLQFHGVISVYHTRPMLQHTVAGFIFGGSGYPSHYYDMWRVVVDPSLLERANAHANNPPTPKVSTGEEGGSPASPSKSSSGPRSPGAAERRGTKTSLKEQGSLSVPGGAGSRKVSRRTNRSVASHNSSGSGAANNKRASASTNH